MTHKKQSLIPESVPKFVAYSLGVPAYRTKTACQQLSKSPLSNFNGVHFIEELFRLMDKNWASILLQHRQPSKKNWRWFQPQLTLGHKNPSKEVSLERKLIQACEKCIRTDWSNQIPVASGLLASTQNRRSAIDLVHSLRSDISEIELVELKVTSNTPLFAAMEIVLYGIIYLLSQRDRERLGYSDRKLLSASVVRLCVLAPSDFYQPYNLHWLEAQLRKGVQHIGSQHSLNLDFEFQKFPTNFVWRNDYKTEALCSFLDRRRPAYLNANSHS